MSVLQRRRLGRTGLEVSCLGLGAMGVIGFNHASRRSGEVLVRRAIDLGIDLIDTAASYFDSEEVLGRALAGRRERVLLASKSIMRRARACATELEQSLRRLRTDRIDLYQLHHVQYRHELEQVIGPGGALEALSQARARGLVRFIGITSHHPGVLVEALKTGHFDTVQLPLNPIEAQTFRPVIDAAVGLDLGVLAMKPLSGGRLTCVEAALRFAAAHPVSCVLAGCTSVAQLERDVAALAGEQQPASDAERRALEAEIAELGELFCRRCRYCEAACGARLPISDIFRCHDYLVLNQSYAREEYRRLAGRERACTDCGSCERICPYNLPVREMLRVARGELERKRWMDLATRLLHATRTYDLTRRAFFRIGGARFLPRHRYLHQKDIAESKQR